MPIQAGDRVRISPKVDVYGMMGRFVHQCGTVRKIVQLQGGYIVAEIEMDNFDRDCAVQIKHLEKISG